MTFFELKTQIDDELSGLMDWPLEKQLRAYELLHLTGCRMEGIKSRIEALIRKRVAESGKENR